MDVTLHWLPIASAPHIAQVPVLLRSRGNTLVGYWDEEEQGWYEWGNGYLDAQPTHWLPLPNDGEH